EQAVPDSKRVVENSVSYASDDVAERLPRDPKTWSKIVAVAVIEQLRRCNDPPGGGIEVCDAAVSFMERRLVVISHPGIHRDVSPRRPFVLHVIARRPRAKIARCVSRQAERVGGQP